MSKLPREQYMTVLGGYVLDMHNHGELQRPAPINVNAPGDYGADPVGDGKFRMVPSGDIVDYEERTRRLTNPREGL